jgi:hypothetical protein
MWVREARCGVRRLQRDVRHLASFQRARALLHQPRLGRAPRELAKVELVELTRRLSGDPIVPLDEVGQALIGQIEEAELRNAHAGQLGDPHTQVLVLRHVDIALVRRTPEHAPSTSVLASRDLNEVDRCRATSAQLGLTR